ncbi:MULTISPECIES: sensor histidine kinase [Streptomyces]|uniref:histidine kinase n=2 Tax=Streptomyces TaxID=1883 RepID=A0ABU4K6E3_9ACTN|nr:nitrate- and nitrite sensing domain-containing protein [Streptomyces roseolus]MDX2293330.1 nitrate- and nitrite sensing domain-containing protein [Streptomyces roseolus]
MRFRGKSIRRKIVALLLVPLVSLTGLWGFATVLTGREADQLLDVGYIVDKVGYPIEDTARVIQLERRQSLVYLADPRGSEALTQLREARLATDRQMDRIRANAEDPGVREEMRPVTTQKLNSLLAAFEEISSLRRSVEKRSIGRLQALEFYNRLVDPCYSFLVTLHALENVEMDKQGRALVGITRARELLSREDALVLSALVADRVTEQEIRAVSDLIAVRKQTYEVNLELLPASERRRFEQYWRSPDTAALRTAEEAFVREGETERPRSSTPAFWQDEASPVLDQLARENTAAGDRYQDRVQPAAYSVLLKAGVAGVLGFLALLASVGISVRIGRSLVRDLRRLQKEAQEVSGVRLPSVMRRLAAGEHVDVETEVPHLRYGEDEVGQVGQALNTLQRAAVEAAVKQADMRRGVAEVFVNLARRNQVLLHRQLTLLDTMERRTEDTEELADLFRLDHLTTRMRRHAEGLVILSGAAPSRQWRKPVQLMDVVRAAVAEVEDYERIEVRRLPRLGVGGPAVADLTHLIAELLENATVFSPPHTAVQVLGERVANGFTLEIHDRGLGMSADVLLDANLRLAETPEFELSDTDRLGLFVVSRLAQRQNVRVSLQTSPYGGTTAVVFIPAALLTDAPETQGAGFRLDRKTLDPRPADGEAHPAASGSRTTSGSAAGMLGEAPLPQRRPALARVPDLADETGPAGHRPADGAFGPVADRPLDRPLDGPVELEPPFGPEDLGTLLDRSADLLDSDSDSERGGLFRPQRRRTGLVPAGEQHQQVPDQAEDRRGDDDPAGEDDAHGPLALPRRRQPTLVVDHGRRLDEPGRAHPAPGPDRRTAPRTGPTLVPVRPEGTEARPAPGPAAPPAADPAPAPPLDGLPRRVRQASLVPQLRETEDPADAPAGERPAAERGAGDDAFERDAEEVRARMAAMQRGWQRGRRDGTGPDDTTAHGTTPEGDGR